MVLTKNWEFLANYQSFELVTRDYTSRHGRKPCIRHAREIAAPFVHARSYFEAAKSADATVKPLLLYYGVVSLSRGLTLMRRRGCREATLAQSHGLSVKDWGSELSRDNPDFGALRIVINDSGTFVETASATEFKSLLRRNSSVPNYTYVNSSAISGAEISLGDLVARLPRLQEHYGRWGGEARCAYLDFLAIGEEVRIRFRKTGHTAVSSPVADAIMLGTAFVRESETPNEVVFKGPNSVDALPGITDLPNCDVFGIGDLWLTALYTGSIKLSKISAMFALSYILGMLVRYYPTQWTALLRGQMADAALPTLAAAVDMIEQEFPQFVLEFLGPQPPS